MSEYIFTPPYSSLLKEVCAALEISEGVLKITGQPGCGVSSLALRIAARLHKNQYRVVYFDKAPDSVDILQNTILKTLQLPTDRYFTRTLTKHLLADPAQLPMVVILDNAQDMDYLTFSAVRMLCNIQDDHKELVRVILCGSPQLDQKLNTPSFRSLAQHIGYSVILEHMTEAQARDFSHTQWIAVHGEATPPDSEQLRKLFLQSAGKPAALAELVSAARPASSLAAKESARVAPAPGVPPVAANSQAGQIPAHNLHTGVSMAAEPESRLETAVTEKAPDLSQAHDPVPPNQETKPDQAVENAGRKPWRISFAKLIAAALAWRGSEDTQDIQEQSPVNLSTEDIQRQSPARRRALLLLIPLLMLAAVGLIWQMNKPAVAPPSPSVVVVVPATPGPVQPEPAPVAVAQAAPSEEPAPAPEPGLEAVTATLVQEVDALTEQVALIESAPLKINDTGLVVAAEKLGLAAMPDTGNSEPAAPQTTPLPETITSVLDQNGAPASSTAQPESIPVPEIAAAAEPAPLNRNAQTALDSPVPGKPVATASAAVDADTGDIQQAAVATLEGWINVWLARDIAAYLAYYAPDYIPAYTDTLAEWRRQRERNIANATELQISYSDLEIEPLAATANGANRLRLQFWLAYRSATYSDNTLKELVLVQTDAGWRILSERNIELNIVF